MILNEKSAVKKKIQIQVFVWLSLSNMGAV